VCWGHQRRKTNKIQEIQPFRDNGGVKKDVGRCCKVFFFPLGDGVVRKDAKGISQRTLGAQGKVSMNLGRISTLGFQCLAMNMEG